MLRLLKWLFTGDAHLHQWKILEQRDVNDQGSMIGTVYISQCTVCGKIKQTDIKSIEI